MSLTTTTRGLLAALLLGAALRCQLPSPVDGPPWWGVADNDTVSIVWDFNNQLTPFAHHPASVVPAWYTFPPPPTDGWSFTGQPLTWFATLNGHTGCVGFTGNGTPLSAIASLLVDNDPRPNWIKVFFLQFDSTFAASGKVTGAIRQVLGQYKRVDIKEETVSIGNGWFRTTVNAELLPQPDWEACDFTLTETGLGTDAIDNLFVNSKCVQPPPDQTGDALADTDTSLGPPGSQGVIDLASPSSTNNTRCQAVAVTESPPPGNVRTYWISAAAQPTVGAPHLLFRLNATGTQSAPALAVGTFSNTAPLGLTGLTVEKASAAQSFVWGVRDLRLAGGPIELVSIDANTGAIGPVVALQPGALTLPPPPHAFGITFSPPGNTGAGSFWLTDNQNQAALAGSAYEFSRGGVLLNPTATTPRTLVGRLPRQSIGSGYDPLTGMLYFMSSDPLVTPQGTTRVNGLEISAYDYQPTGVQFFGDLRLPDPLNPGGVVLAFDVYRRNNGDFRAPTIVSAGGLTLLYELKGPFRFGWNLLGQCGMAGDPPMRGYANFRVTLSGVPNATGAILEAGFSNTLYGTTALPFNLGFVGLPESNVSVSLDMNSPFLPVVNGRCFYVIPLLPAGVGPAYVPLFFQWVVFDLTAPFGIATSQAGKTVIY